MENVTAIPILNVMKIVHVMFTAPSKNRGRNEIEKNGQWICPEPTPCERFVASNREATQPVILTSKGGGQNGPKR